MRGISGCGKSTYTKKHFPGAVIVSADHYFEQGGKYKFDQTKLPAAHAWCFKNFESALKVGKPLVVVDNTNTRKWEMERYVEAAKAAGYDVDVVRLVCDPAVAAARNVHQVPVDAVAAMAARFEPYPGEHIVNQK